jgi:hypothetical protein
MNKGEDKMKHYGYSLSARDAIIKTLKEDYIDKNKSIKEIAEEYGFTERQIRYLITNYLGIKKGSGNYRHKKGVTKMKEESEFEEYTIKGKKVKARKATVQDLMLKADLIKEQETLEKELKKQIKEEMQEERRRKAQKEAEKKRADKIRQELEGHSTNKKVEI